jgi:hypothetical protein
MHCTQLQENILAASCHVFCKTQQTHMSYSAPCVVCRCAACAFIQAFEARLKKDLNTTAAALLLPKNKALLTRVLQV